MPTFSRPHETKSSLDRNFGSMGDLLHNAGERDRVSQLACQDVREILLMGSFPVKDTLATHMHACMHARRPTYTHTIQQF